MTTAKFSTIARDFGILVAEYAEKNCAGWVIDRLADDRLVTRGPKMGKRENACFAATTTGATVIEAASRMHQTVGC